MMIINSKINMLVMQTFVVGVTLSVGFIKFCHVNIFVEQNGMKGVQTLMFSFWFNGNNQ